MSLCTWQERILLSLPGCHNPQLPNRKKETVNTNCCIWRIATQSQTPIVYDRFNGWHLGNPDFIPTYKCPVAVMNTNNFQSNLKGNHLNPSPATVKFNGIKQTLIRVLSRRHGKETGFPNNWVSIKQGLGIALSKIMRPRNFVLSFFHPALPT